MTMTQDGKAVGARVPPHWASLLFSPGCAISGYETGDPTKGCCSGMAAFYLIMNILTCIGGGLCALMMWKPDPEKIQGDGTQRTVEDKCSAGCWAGGIQTVAFWESGDMCCTPDGQCTWCSGDAMMALIWHFGPAVIGLPSLDCCFVMCAWQPNPMNFRRSTVNHGGGQQIVGAPVQVGQTYVELRQVISSQQSQVVGAPVQAGVVQGSVVQVQQPQVVQATNVQVVSNEKAS